MTTTECDLVIVGAGPVGLATALFARSIGLEPVVVDARDELGPGVGSRALFVHRDSLMLLDAAAPGLGREIGEFGLVWERRRTLYSGHTVYDRPERHGSEHPRSYTCLRQADTERFLRTRYAAGGATVRWGTRVTAVEPRSRGVVVHTGSDTVRAAYVVVADGGRSTVRASLGIGLDGQRSNAYHVVVDLADDPALPAPAVREFHYRHPQIGGRNVLIVPFSGGRQVDVQCLATEHPEELADGAAVQSWLPLVLDPDYANRVLSTSWYPFHQRVATRFVDDSGRVLLAGDAAHLFAPFGARGMNSGFADAGCAGAAVAEALAAASPEQAAAAVQAYGNVRRAAALRNRAAAGTALAHMRAESGWARARQSLAALGAPAIPAWGRWLERSPYGPHTSLPAGSETRY